MGISLSAVCKQMILALTRAEDRSSGFCLSSVVLLHISCALANWIVFQYAPQGFSCCRCLAVPSAKNAFQISDSWSFKHPYFSCLQDRSLILVGHSENSILSFAGFPSWLEWRFLSSASGNSDLPSLEWTPQISIWINIQMILMQKIHGPSFEGHNLNL